MNKPLVTKVLLVALLALLLMIPLGMIDGIVAERQSRQWEATNDIALRYAGSQRLAGPVLVLPYTEEYTELVWDTPTAGAPAPERPGKHEVRRRVEHALYLFPQALRLDGSLDTDFKHRGLFRTLVYAWTTTVEGSFTLPAAPALQRRQEDSRISWGRAFLAVGLSDTRGIAGAPQLRWNEGERAFAQGSGIAFLGNGIHAELGVIEPGQPQRFAFSLALTLRGTESLAVVPLADTTEVALRSAWPHPSYGGRFLPDPRSQYQGDDGFRAQWHITALATTAQRAFLDAAAGRGGCDGGCLEDLQLRFVEPVNIYTQANRALKYGFLFIGLTFAAFFLFEILRALRIHPAQYLLVGLALALFFLLLISLSEHIPFALAYLAAASACVGLLGFYLGYVLGSRARGVGFAVLLGALYAALYGLLVSEDNALLMGALLLFGLLATAMTVTRRLDWYALASRTAPPAAAAAQA